VDRSGSSPDAKRPPAEAGSPSAISPCVSWEGTRAVTHQVGVAGSFLESSSAKSPSRVNWAALCGPGNETPAARACTPGRYTNCITRRAERNPEAAAIRKAEDGGSRQRRNDPGLLVTGRGRYACVAHIVASCMAVQPTPEPGGKGPMCRSQSRSARWVPQRRH
jgi:hypothetical protein